MKRQNLHLTVMSITIILAFAMLSYGRAAVDRNVLIAVDSHFGRHAISEPRPLERLGAATTGRRISRSSNETAGQIGQLLSRKGGQIG